MPLFMDIHQDLPPPPPERAEMLRNLIKSGERDENGSRGVNIYYGADGSTTCMFDAPNADAVKGAHEAAGVPIDPHAIREVTPLVT